MNKNLNFNQPNGDITEEDIAEFRANMNKYIYSMTPEEQEEFRANLGKYVADCIVKVEKLKDKLCKEHELSQVDKSQDVNGMGAVGAVSFISTLFANFSIAGNINPDFLMSEDVAKPMAFAILTAIEALVISALNEYAYATRPISNKYHEYRAHKLGKQISKLKTDISTGTIIMADMDNMGYTVEKEEM